MVRYIFKKDNVLLEGSRGTVATRASLAGNAGRGHQSYATTRGRRINFYIKNNISPRKFPFAVRNLPAPGRNDSRIEQRLEKAYPRKCF